MQGWSRAVRAGPVQAWLASPGPHCWNSGLSVGARPQKDLTVRPGPGPTGGHPGSFRSTASTQRYFP